MSRARTLANFGGTDLATQAELDAQLFDDNPIQTNLAMLAIRQAADHNDVKYSLQDRIIDNYYDASGVDDTPSTNHNLTAGVYSGGSTTTISNTYDVTGATNDVGTVQSLTFHASTTSVTIEAWGGRGGAGMNSWKKNTSGTIDNTSGAAGSEEGGGFTVRLKGTYAGFDGGETIKIVVGKTAAFGDSTTDYGSHSGGGGASWVFLEHASAIGQTRGVANSKIWTPLIVAGGGGGASVRSGNTEGQDQTPWTRHGEADANLATSDGGTRLGTLVSPLTSSNSGKYTQGTDDGEGGTGTSTYGSGYSGAGGAGFLADGGVPTIVHSSYGDANSIGLHPFHGSTPFKGGQDGSTYGDAFGGYGGGGGGSLAGAGGGGGFSGGSSCGNWNTDSCNGIGGGSLFGSTVSIGGSYENVISVTENTNILADDADASPATGKLNGRVIIVQSYVVNNDLTLQSTDTTAEAAPTKADMVMLMEDAAGTATVNTDIKGFVSRDSGSTFIEGTLVDEGDWGTNKRILAFHDLSFTGASGTAMCYKITTHNQTAGKQTKVHATSIGWK